MEKMTAKPNILFIMCDQFRYDCIHALGNEKIRTPNLDRLVEQGIAFENAYSTCPVCVPARYTVRTGCEPAVTGCYMNEVPKAMDNLPDTMEERCGEYLAAEMRKLGYDTFGIGKFHTNPQFDEDCGYDLQMNIEEMWDTEKMREKDAYASYIRREHPEYSHLEQLHGERTNMYYMPQMSPLPAELTVEAFTADLAVEQIKADRDKPYFGFVSFIGPHPPCAPPIPYNRMYDPDEMENPRTSDIGIDFMDEQIPWMNHLIWADEMNDFLVRNVKSRYYGEITYIDDCIGRLLDAVEAENDRDNTLICFFSDHGDHMGDHHAWQKESYFEEACHVPFLLSWPARYKKSREKQLVCLTDLFGIATGAAGQTQVRDGHGILDVLDGTVGERKEIFAVYGRPGTPLFKAMLRTGRWKYIYMANGGREQLFDLETDPHEQKLQNSLQPQILEELYKTVWERCKRPGLLQAREGKKLKSFPFTQRPLFRIRQFDLSRGIKDFGM